LSLTSPDPYQDEQSLDHFLHLIRAKVMNVFYKYVEFGKDDKAYMKNTPHVPLRQIAEE
jgi:hypothetical protein